MQYSNWTHILTSTQIYPPAPPPACLHARSRAKKQIGNPFQRCSASLSTSAFPCARPLSGLLSYSLSYGGRRWKGAGGGRDGGAGREEVRLRQKPGNERETSRDLAVCTVDECVRSLASLFFCRDQMYLRGHTPVTGAVWLFEEAKSRCERQHRPA